MQDHILADVQSRGEMREKEDWKCPLPTRCKFRMRLFFLTERRRRRVSTKIKENRKRVSSSSLNLGQKQLLPGSRRSPFRTVLNRRNGC
jgi:hypothetical protein